MSVDLSLLETVRTATGTPFTTGVTDAALAPFLSNVQLAAAIKQANTQFQTLAEADRELLTRPEQEVLQELQSGFLNFYPPESVSCYVPLAAKGPWVVSAYGAIIYDTGGYGMLGQGHNPDFVESVLRTDRVMANIMTPSLEQRRFAQCLKKEIGHNRKAGCPYARFLCMNSGSEAMSVATRISDLHAGTMTNPGAVHESAVIKIMALKGAFHGRTGRPGRASNSSLNAYKQLASFRNYTGTLTVKPNDIADLERVFQEAVERGEYIEFMMLEPVMGEGNPGLAITPEFYKRARELTREHGSFLIVDSIQAGLRAQGELSIVDYPGFTKLDPPDMESYSKAINAGQFPVSVLALSQEVVDLYQPGIYGNTMTANPRALAITIATLEQFTDKTRQNILAKGKEFVGKLQELQQEFPDKIVHAQGSGLIVSCELVPAIKVIGNGSIEERMRQAGINVIHGGENSLRFTPHFYVDSAEIALIIQTFKSLLGTY